MYKLLHGDCVDILRTFTSESVDCIVTDPPYGVGLEYESYDDTQENLRRLIHDALPEMRRVARRVALTCGTSNIHLYPKPTWILAWTYHSQSYTPWGWDGWQPILVYGTDPHHKLRMRKPTVIRFQSFQKREPGHPCPKPLGFMRRLITRVSPSPNDVVLDPFMGSGTTGVAAIELGHRFIGIEISSNYFAIAEKRIARARPNFPRLIKEPLKWNFPTLQTSTTDSSPSCGKTSESA